MVSYLYFFNPCISVIENGRYLSHSSIQQYESGHPWRTPHITVKGSDRRPFFFSFRLDTGVRSFNFVNKFVSITKLKNGRINLQIANLWQSKLTKAVKSQCTLWKIHENSKIFKQDCYLTYVKHQWWKMCVILLFLIVAEWFSPIIASKVVCIWFLGIVV